MDKLKTKVLFVALIILALVSVSAVAAADVDDVVSADQNDIDLSEETVNEVQSTQETEILADEEPTQEQNPDGSSYVTVKFSYMNETTEGKYVEYVYRENYKISSGRNISVGYSTTFSRLVPNNHQFQYDGSKYVFKNWTSSLTGDVVPRYQNQVLFATGYNYTVVYTSEYDIYKNTVLTVNWNMKDSNGEDKIVTKTYDLIHPYSVTIFAANFTNEISNYTTYTDDGQEYVFDHWEDEEGNIVDATVKHEYPYNGEDQTVTFNAIYKATGKPSNITVKVVGFKDVNGNDVNSELTNKIDPGVTWIVRYAMFEDEINRYQTYDANGIHYTFKHILDPDGVPITDPESYERALKPNGTDYTVIYTVVYDEEIIGNFTLIYNDALGHGSGSWNSTHNYGVDFEHTFILPADIPSGAQFLYWEMEDTLEKFNPGDKFNVEYGDFAGKTVVKYVNAVYDIETSIELKEITDYVENVVDITAEINSDVFKVDDPNGGTATLTIDYGNGNTYTQTVDVKDGQAVFKDVKLENPGDFTYKVEYSGFSYNKHEEGINDYLPSSAESKLHVLALNTTVSNESATGKPGDKVTVEFTVTDQNNNPVANGTLTVTVDGTPYTAEVKKGKATFEDIVLPNPGNYSYVVNYEGNDYYNPSVGQLNLTVLKVDTSVSNESETGKPGDKVSVEFAVTDEFDEPVANGTLTVTVDGTPYTAEVKNGKATFEDIVLPNPGNYSYVVNYEGNDYYNPSVGQLNLTVQKVDVIVTLPEVINYTGAVVDIVVDVVDEYGNLVNEGTVTLTIDWGTKLSDKLMATAQTLTEEVHNGKATFKGITLGEPGTYPSKAEFSGTDYYNEAENESDVIVLPLNTTTESDDVSGKAGEKKDITADIVDQNGNPVKNGTAVLKVNGKEYTAEVKDGKATFKDVELPDESTEATIEYLGNEYYNPSSTTIQITIIPEDEPIDDETEEEPSTPTSEKTVPVMPAAGNPIALVVVALLSLVSTVSFGRKK